jgi:NADH-ubiquinone oxidoreductase chain 5
LSGLERRSAKSLCKIFYTQGSNPIFNKMYLLLISLPLIGSIFAGLLGRQLGSYGSAFVTTGCIFLSFIISLLVFYEVSFTISSVYIALSIWIKSETLVINWGFMFDSLTAVMCIVVIFISFLVHLYSIEYMFSDPHLPRFMSYLSLFTFFMLMLVTADNFIQMFLGWEGVGLCSYLLINFWFTRIQANKAAIKAMILNRIGDFSLLIGILLILTYFKAADYITISALTQFFTNKNVNFFLFDINLLTLIGFFLFFGSVGKSAQLGLHTWLPDAMEGPTPVSALIHAATMVTAGVFLLARSSFLYEQIDVVLKFIVVIGSVTSIFASTAGLVQNDLKRVIAYSTCSQLGYMIFACGLSNYSVSVFHLSNHAFFKALLFLSAGSVIHAVNDEQDVRKMGGLRNSLAFTYSMMFIGSLALIGFPFLAGFYSKDLILELSYVKYNGFGQFAYVLGTIGAFFTSFYSTRLLILTFIVKPNGYKKVLSYVSDSGLNISSVLGCLAISSIFIGYMTKDMFVGVGNFFFNNVIYVKACNLDLFDAEFMLYNNFLFKNTPIFSFLNLELTSSNIKTLPLISSFFGVFIAYCVYLLLDDEIILIIKTSSTGRKIYQFLNRKWFFDKIYNDVLGQMFFRFGYSVSYKFVERGILEALGPTGISTTAIKTALNLHKAQTSQIYHYTFTILIGITVLTGFKQILMLEQFFNTIAVALIFIFIFFLINNKEDFAGNDKT